MNKRGRKTGQMTSGSRNDILSQMEVGERFYVECEGTTESYSAVMRTYNTPKGRRPEILKGREFTTNIFTCVPVKIGEPVRYLVCIERIE